MSTETILVTVTLLIIFAPSLEVPWRLWRIRRRARHDQRQGWTISPSRQPGFVRVSVSGAQTLTLNPGEKVLVGTAKELEIERLRLGENNSNEH